MTQFNSLIACLKLLCKANEITTGQLYLATMNYCLLIAFIKYSVQVLVLFSIYSCSTN